MLSSNIKTARLLAEYQHQGQIDKSGKPYIMHPERVAGRLNSSEEKVVAWLHDVVEDTDYPLCEIERQFGPETASAIDAISRRKNETWDHYLQRVKQNPTARSVKISDLVDNSNLSRLENITIDDVKRQEKYNHALQFLMSE